jgi:hypothetical protein
MKGNHPAPGDVVRNPAHVAGYGTAFEGMISLRIRDDANTVIAEGSTQGGSNGVIGEFNSPPLFSDNWHTFQFEAKRRRRPQRSRRWQVRNTQTNDAYNLIAGADDGVADDFGRGDVWILRFCETEIEDGVVAIGAPFAADIDRFVNGEDVSNQDVVVWYAAHFTHDVGEEEEHGHYVGPTLRPVNW